MFAVKHIGVDAAGEFSSRFVNNADGAFDGLAGNLLVHARNDSGLERGEGFPQANLAAAGG